MGRPTREATSPTLAAQYSECTPSGVVTVLHGFTDPGRATAPRADSSQGSDGNFYGTTEDGGTSNLGAIYRVTPAGDFTVLHQFTGSHPTGPTDGAQPFGEMILASDGNFYGTTSGGGTGGLGTIFQLTPAGVYTTVYSFPNNGTAGFGTPATSHGGHYSKPATATSTARPQAAALATSARSFGSTSFPSQRS